MPKKKLWGGRFKKEMHPSLKCFSYSLAVDKELFDAEIEVNIAWSQMLGRQGIISKSEAASLVKALKSISETLSGNISEKESAVHEDIHSLIQASLEKKCGVLGKKIHTGRSRNDLVVTSTRFYLKQRIDAIDAAIVELQKALVHTAKKAGGLMLSGMTHLRKAQPVLLAHHLLAYAEMLEDDRQRLLDGRKRTDVLVLGAAALAGSSLPIDQKFLAEKLGFTKIASNSMAAVSDRGFLTEFLSGLSLLWMHLSRLSEDFILWNSEPFSIVELDDSFATGSSLMPQKKNPDVFELVRGRSAGIFAALQALLVVQKGLPLTYNRDLQEDKKGVFEAVHVTLGALDLLALTIDSANWNRQGLAASVNDDSIFATDVLEYLVRKKEPFSSAHEIVGKVVAYSAEKHVPLRELTLSEWKKFSKKVAADVYDLFDPLTSVKGKKTIGSTNPSSVKKEIVKWERTFEKK